uniref:protein PLASTID TRANSCRIPTIONALLY ACTIVE 16, chloroplastic n=1 Tax=Erigeron canadensis TaxID=72917 RepID=UPI001CB9C8CD|nr:protein PLASTID TRANSCRIPTIONALLY ACTIVE 16, chloroplastic [Erigeron canadensis]
MAPALTANSFLLTATTHSSLSSRKNPKRLITCAKKADAGGADSEVENGNRFKFNFDFGKVSDMKSLIPVMSNPSASGGTLFGKRKDPNTVFVAGATGQAGIRIAQTLLREGFSVRAGVTELGAAQELARLAVNYKVISTEESKRLNAVESTFQDPEAIAKAIGNATKAVVTIGPGENGPTTEVSTTEALQFIQGAQLAGVNHVTIIYDTAIESFTSTNNVLDGLSLFFNNLFSNTQPLTLKEFLDGLIETDVKYTLIKTKLTADYGSESSYNFVVTAEGITGENDYKVTKSQIASLVADVFSNTEVAENKVVEVATSPDAAAKPVSELFSVIPEDGRRQAYAETIAKAKAEEAVKAAEKAAKAAAKAENEVKRLEPASSSSVDEDVQDRGTTARKSLSDLMDRLKTARLASKPTEKSEPIAEDDPDQDSAPGLALSWEKLSSGFASAVKNNPIELPKVQIATVRGQAKARTLPSKQAVVKKPAAKKVAPVQPKPKESKAEVRKIFGGVFQQETIYVDD